MAVNTSSQGWGLTGEQRRALVMLADSQDGCTEAIMIAHRFQLDLLVGLIRAGLAVAQPEIVKAGGRVIGVVRVLITDTSRRSPP
jgi:hypothetical protein